MLSLTAAQLQKAHSAKPMQVALVKLTTFSDYTAQTVASTFYWSTLPLLYRWDGAAVNQFQAFLSGVSDVIRTMPHLPDDKRLATLTKLTLNLSNEQWGDDPLWKILDDENLVAAQVEVASLLLDWSAATDASWLDQSATVVDHIVRWRGEVDSMPSFDSEATTFVIQCVTKEAPLPWARALNSDEVSAKHLGRLYPVPVGPAKRVELVQRQVGWLTTLGTAISETTTGNIDVTDATGFPSSGTFYFWIGSEKLSATFTTDTTINITGRGQFSGTQASTAQNHLTGALLIEETEAPRFVYSSVATQGVDVLYARSPITGELIRIPNSFYSTHQADTELDAGLALGVVTFTRQLWAQLIKRVNAEPGVTVQPAVSATGSETIMVKFGSMSVATIHVGAVDNDVRQPTDDGSGMVMDISTSGSPRNAAAFIMFPGSVPGGDRGVVRYRAVFDYRIESDATHATKMYFDWDSSVFGDSKPKTLLQNFNPGSASQEWNTKASVWLTPPGGTEMSDLEFGTVFVYLDNGGGGSSAQTELFIASTSRWEVEVEGIDVQVTSSTEVTGAEEIGFNLDLFVDVRGVVQLGSSTASTKMDAIAQTTDDWVGFQCSLTNHAGAGVTSTGDGTGTFRQLTLTNTTPAIDMSGARVSFDVKLDAATQLLMSQINTAFRVELQSTAGNANIWAWNRNVLHATGDWVKFTFDPAGNPTDLIDVDGTLDLTSITKIEVTWITLLTTSVGVVSIRSLVVEAREYLTHPTDIAQWLIEDELGEAVDSASFATAKTNLPSVVMAGDLREAGTTPAEVLGRIGFESRTNFIGSEASAVTEFRALNALSTYAFPAAAATLVVGDYGALKVSTKQLGERPTEFNAIFDRHHDLGLSERLAYRGLIQANTNTNDLSGDGVPTADLTTQQALVGVRPSELEVFTLLVDTASAIEVWAYYVAEALRGTSKRFTMELPYRHSYALELGDILTLTPTYTTSTVKVRVTALAFSFSQPTILVSVEEVL